MRFLVMIIPGAYSTELGDQVLEPKTSSANRTDPSPGAEEMAKMGKFNEELKQAGLLRAVDGLLPLRRGARLTFVGGKASVIDGPSIEAKEVVGGFWLLQADSKQQVIDWMKRCPVQPDDVVEIRQIAEWSDFSPDVQAAQVK